MDWEETDEDAALCIEDIELQRAKFQRNYSSALQRLNQGSQYETPQSENPTDFRKRLSIRISSSVLKPSPGKPDPELIPRLIPINALVDSENSYVADLKILHNIYFQPIKETLLITPLQMATIFCNFEYIVSVNEELSSQLNGLRMMHPALQLIGEEFIRLADYFGMYTQYCANVFKATKELNALSKSNKRFARFLDKAKSLPESHGQSLEQLLNKPCDRVRAYPAYLKRLLDATPKSHADHALLLKALSLLEELVTNVENERKIIENNLKILQIEISIEGNEKFGEPDRWFLTEGNIQWAENDQLKGNRHLFLFSNLLLVTSRKPTRLGISSSKTQFVLREKIMLKYLLVRDFPNPSNRTYRFDLIRNDRVVVYNLIFASPNSKLEWLQIFEEAVNKELEIESKKHVQARTEQMQQPQKLPDEPLYLTKIPSGKRGTYSSLKEHTRGLLNGHSSSLPNPFSAKNKTAHNELKSSSNNVENLDEESEVIGALEKFKSTTTVTTSPRHSSRKIAVSTVCARGVHDVMNEKVSPRSLSSNNVSSSGLKKPPRPPPRAPTSNQLAGAVITPVIDPVLEKKALIETDFGTKTTYRFARRVIDVPSTKIQRSVVKL